VGTLADMVADSLTLDYYFASIIRTWNWLHFTYLVMNFCDGSIRALLSTILTFVISVGAVVLQVLV
jgi:hypothetical protein